MYQNALGGRAGRSDLLGQVERSFRPPSREVCDPWRGETTIGNRRRGEMGRESGRWGREDGCHLNCQKRSTPLVVSLLYRSSG